MLDFGTKTNDTAGAGGQVEDTEYNSLFSEVKNVITKTGIALDGGKTDQMIKAIDKISKATEYQDNGTANTIQLTRQATGDTIEELFDGMVVYFSPKFANTGATTLKIATLLAKPTKYLGVDVTADFFKVEYNYKAVYDLGNEWFECDVVANKKYVEGAYNFEGMLTTDNFLHIQDQKPSGTDGGSSVAGDQTRVLNTILTNSIVGASLLSNQITLPAGDYYIEASVPGYRVNAHKAKLTNITDGLDIVIGTSEYADNGITVSNRTVINGFFTLVTTKIFEIKHYTGVAYSTFALGYGTANGDIEVYTDVKIWKVG